MPGLRSRLLLRCAAALLGLVLLNACGGAAPTELPRPSDVLDDEIESTGSPTGSPAGTPWIVSLGDSFISGEAGRWAGNSAGGSSLVDALGPSAYFDAPDGKSELIPLCHRSAAAMVHIEDDGPPSGRGVGNPVGSTNLACSGAQTRTSTEDGAFKPGLDFTGAGTAKQGQAAMLQDLAQQRNVTMVLVSIGGNDFGFADVIEDCLEDYIEDRDPCSKSSSITDKISKTNVDTVTGRITNALLNVQKAMRDAGRTDGSWTLVVNLNPDTLPLAGGFRYGETYSRWYDGGCGFYDADAQWAGTQFVSTVRSAAANALQTSRITPSALLDFSKLLDKRELCATGTLQVGSSSGAATWQAGGAVDISEWSDEIRAEDTGPYFEQESLHPNYWAQLAMRSCVRQLFAGERRVNGSCVRTGDGLTPRGEPVVTLQ